MLQKGNEFMITKMTNRMICNTASKFVPMKYNLDLIFDLPAKRAESSEEMCKLFKFTICTSLLYIFITL